MICSPAFGASAVIASAPNGAIMRSSRACSVTHLGPDFSFQ
jgi:hypothetical protein